MIISFQVANFRSLRDSALLSMEATADTDQPGGIEVVRQVEGLPAGNHGVLPVAVLYGANAAGKSNVVKALDLLCELVVFPVRFQQQEELIRFFNPRKRIQPFRLDGESREAPVEFDLAFLHQGVRYAYALSTSQDRIWGESLRAWPEGREALLFARGDYIPQDKSSHLKKTDKDEGMPQTVWEVREEAPIYATPQEAEAWYWGPSFVGGLKEAQALAGRTRPDMPFLSACAIWDHPQCREVMGWFIQQFRLLDVETFDHRTVDRTTQICAQNQSLLKQVEGLLQAADLGIQGLDIESRDVEVKRGGDLPPGKDTRHRAFALHTDREGQSVRFDIQQDESYGTQRIFGLAPQIVRTLARGGVLVVDELHAGLHPLLLRCLVRLFQSPKTNPKGAQLIFATHDVTLLDSSLLRRDQIYLAEKGKDGASTLYSLSDFKDKPRKEVPLMKHYLAGRFAAVPHLAEEEVWAGFAKAFADEKEGA